MTRADVSSDLVGELVRGVLTNLQGLRGETPILARLDPARMATDGPTAPLHEAAQVAFDEFAGEASPGQ